MKSFIMVDKYSTLMHRSFNGAPLRVCVLHKLHDEKILLPQQTSRNVMFSNDHSAARKTLLIIQRNTIFIPLRSRFRVCIKQQIPPNLSNLFNNDVDYKNHAFWPTPTYNKWRIKSFYGRPCITKSLREPTLPEIGSPPSRKGSLWP